ncbi:MAG: Rne/Rng family ribonuclease [bacterium]|mgnify:CR=1 FL=1
MTTELIVNATSYETRVALLENNNVVEIYIDRKKGRGVVGNIYRGRVIKVLPGMQAAFVDIGLEKSAFLYVSDIYSKVEHYPQMIPENEFEDEEIDEENDEEIKEEYTQISYTTPIEDLLKEGQEIVVQVAKEPIGTKGARVTSYISLPGRNLVYMPSVDHVGISRKISDEKERERLRGIIKGLKGPEEGYIVRTVSEGKNDEEFMADKQFLKRLWVDIQKKSEKASAPCLLHSDLDLVFRVIRDLFTSEVDRMVIDSPSEYYRVKEFVGTFLPNLLSKIELYDGTEPIFDTQGVEVEISRALKRRVWLKSGGYIVIDQTEALVAIDVNTGRYVGKRNLEETIFKTNMEAAREIAYQLRLRNIGGIIILDFIDMEDRKNRMTVFNALQKALMNDKARTTIYEISELGIIQMTRKRVRENLGRIIMEPCSYCEGEGYIKSKITVCYDIFREISRMATLTKEKKILVVAQNDVADMLYDEQRREVEELENKFKKRIVIKGEPEFHQEQFEVMLTS